MLRALYVAIWHLARYLTRFAVVIPAVVTRSLTLLTHGYELMNHNKSMIRANNSAFRDTLYTILIIFIRQGHAFVPPAQRHYCVRDPDGVTDWCPNDAHVTGRKGHHSGGHGCSKTWERHLSAPVTLHKTPWRHWKLPTRECDCMRSCSR
jgi:hypothetical protein